MNRSVSVTCFALLWTLVLTAPARPAPEADQLLPSTTKAFLSIPDVQEFGRRWSETQLGKLSADPIMEPFASDLHRQLRDRLLNGSFSVALSWDELFAACSGELCVAAIQPGNDPKAHASVLLLEVTDRQAEAEQVLAKVAEELQRRGAQRTVKRVGEHEVITQQIPRRRGELESETVIRFLVDDLLVIGNHEPTCLEILERLSGKRQDAEVLQSLPAYRQVMDRVAAESASSSPQLRWYVDPFGYAQVLRTASGGPKKRRKDMLAILQAEGFDAIQGLGGYVHFTTDGYEILHRTQIYAPPLPGAARRYERSARILSFPNTEEWTIPDWVPRDLATFTQFNCGIQQAFEDAKTLVDAVAGDEGFFEDLLTSIKDDPNGPQIDVRQKFVRYLGQRVTVLSDHVYPVTPKSERMLVAVEVTDAEAVRQTVHQALVSDPEARQLEINGHTVWEIIDQEDPQAPDLDLGLDGIDPIGNVPATVEEEEERLLRNSAVTVAQGHLMIATHVDMLQRLLQERPESDQLSRCEDYQLVVRQLQRAGSGADAVRSFSRTDEDYRPTYELIRQGRMPESESLLGKLLNRVLGPEDEEVLRQQQLDGSQLPDFEAVRRYLGPAGLYLRSEKDGWFATGILLDKQAAYLEGTHRPAIAAEETARTNTR